MAKTIENMEDYIKALNDEGIISRIRVSEKYFRNATKHIAKVGEGFIAIPKERIETHFCFGWSSIGQGAEIEDAFKSETRANSDESYFINENLKNINRYIESVKNLDVYIYPKYYVCNADSKILSYSAREYWDNSNYKNERKATEEEKNSIINALEAEKADFVKRLNTYLKKYGLSKLHTWTYCCDD